MVVSLVRWWCLVVSCWLLRPVMEIMLVICLGGGCQDLFCVGLLLCQGSKEACSGVRSLAVPRHPPCPEGLPPRCRCILSVLGVAPRCCCIGRLVRGLWVLGNPKNLPVEVCWVMVEWSSRPRPPSTRASASSASPTAAAARPPSRKPRGKHPQHSPEQWTGSTPTQPDSQPQAAAASSSSDTGTPSSSAQPQWGRYMPGTGDQRTRNKADKTWIHAEFAKRGWTRPARQAPAQPSTAPTSSPRPLPASLVC